MLFRIDSKFHTLSKWINSDNRCKVPQQHLAWRTHLMGTHSTFYCAYDLRVNDNQTQALDFLLSLAVASFPALFLPKNPNYPHGPNYSSSSPLSLPLDSRREVTLPSAARSCDPAQLYSCLLCWNLNSELLDDRDMFCHLCGSLCTMTDTGPQ